MKADPKMSKKRSWKVHDRFMAQVYLERYADNLRDVRENKERNLRLAGLCDDMVTKLKRKRVMNKILGQQVNDLLDTCHEALS